MTKAKKSGPDRIKQLEKENAELTGRIHSLNSILESSTEFAIVATDLELKITQFNPAAEQIYGYKANNVIGKTVLDLFSRHKMDQESFVWAIEAINSQGKYENEVSIETAEGKTVYIHSVIMPLLDQNKERSGYVIFSRDTTEQKEIAETLKNAKQAAEEANKMKSRFLANVSHEIRTPLNCIVGFTETIISSESTSTIHQQARIILQESETLLKLINDLLDHAKMEAGRLDLERHAFDLHLLLRRIMISEKIQADNKEIELNLTRDEDLPQFVLGDALRLRQILVNLINNAIKFTSRGSVNIVVKAFSRNEGQAEISFAVIDTGIGISIENQKSVFKSFIQADGGTTRKYGGTGLGITIAQQLVRSMGGELMLESEPGHGSKFWFSVVMGTCSPPQEPDSITPFLETRPERSLFKGKLAGNILLAEDYGPNQEVARLHLESAGHKVTVADNGEEAVRACDENNFDLVLMDLQMPKMDGFEAAIRIRFNETANSDIPILAMTANADAGTRQACREAIMTDVLTKPIRRVSLLAAVERWLISRIEGTEPAAFDAEISMAAEAMELTEKAPDGAPGSDGDDTPLDYEVALDEFGSIDVLENVVIHFVRNVENQIEIMKESLLTKDRERLRREVHSIKGGASTLEAKPLAELSGQLEEICKHGSMEEAQPVLEAFFAEFDRFRKYVTDEVRLIK